ncbi:flagellar biosynthesis anti-sigma factor FlgM [Sulfurihydrogenibium sp.]|uniref:flagellar biosynthesis anti-sigma factor FlgM n=1 Tax=Sulfurihydrogenibium sp. TaxID=2053621 RepID=UPI0031F32A6F
MCEDNNLDEVLKKLMEELLQEEEMKVQRIEEIKRLIAEGKYDVPVQELVESILKKLKEKS